jgi:predicted membrane channel-forming protein YqfA (hemolysin III family)
MYFWRVDSVWVFPSTIFALIALLFLSVLPSAMENRLVRVATYLAIAWFIVFPLYHLTFRF